MYSKIGFNPDEVSVHPIAQFPSVQFHSSSPRLAFYCTGYIPGWLVNLVPEFGMSLF